MTASILPANLRNIPVSRFIAIVRRGMPRWRRSLRRARPGAYVAEGGPYHGCTLALTDGTSAVIRVGGQRGRYLCGIVAPRFAGSQFRWGRSSANYGTTVWKPMP